MERARCHRARSIGRVLVVAAVLGVPLGCATKGPKPESLARGAQYRRVAIVCTPAPGAEAGYCSSIMEQVAKMAPSRLDFLEKVDLRENVAIDAGTRPPAVKLKDADAYDGIAVLVYSHPGPVVLEMYMLDARTRAEVWHHQLSTEDTDVPGRFARHGFWTPTTIKQQFYGR